MPLLFNDQYYQDNIPIGKAEVERLLQENPQAKALWEKSKQNNVGAIITYGGSLLALYSFLNKNSLDALEHQNWDALKKQQQKDKIHAVGGVAFLGFALYLMLKSREQKKKALAIYNKQLTKKPKIKLQVVPTRNGIGIAVAL